MRSGCGPGGLWRRARGFAPKAALGGPIDIDRLAFALGPLTLKRLLSLLLDTGALDEHSGLLQLPISDVCSIDLISMYKLSNSFSKSFLAHLNVEISKHGPL